MRRRTVAVAVSVLCLVWSVHAAYSAWKWVKEISLNTTSTGANVSGTVTGFPVVLRFDDGSFDFSKAKADGADIRFSKGNGTPLPYEIEHWDGNNRQGVVWVRLDTVYGNSASQVFLMYYGNPAAADSSRPGSVFDTANGFVAVWHLREEMAGTGNSGVYRDATLNALHGDDNVAATGRQGAIGYGHDFTGPSGSDAVYVGPNAAFSFRKGLTWSCWVNADNVADATGQALVQQWTPKHLGLMLFPGSSGGNILRFEIVNDGVDGSSILTDVAMEPGQWYFVAGTFDSASGIGTVWVNGTAKSAAMTQPGDMTTSPLLIGQYGYENWNLDGKLDEVVLSKTARSADWMRLCYANQRPAGQNLVSYGYATWNTQVQVFLNTTASGANVTADVTSFPVLIRLNASTYPAFSSIAAGGADLRFANVRGAPLPYHIERWTADSAEVWVLVDTIRGNDASQYILMYHGKAGAVSLSSGAAVFDTANGFVAVWHLREEVAGTGNPAVYRDATLNGLHGDDNVAATDRQGAIGYGHDFTGPTGSDAITVAANPAFTFRGGLTWSCWVNADGVAYGGQGLVQQWTPKHLGLMLFPASSGGNVLRFEIVNDGVDGSSILTDLAMEPGQWYFVAGTFDSVSGIGTVWVNGTAKSAAMTQPGDMTTSTLRIGSYGYENWNLDGKLDEVVLAKTARSADWMRLCYENQRPDQVLVGISSVPTRPEMALSVDTIQVLTVMGSSRSDTVFQISNIGGGRVAYSLSVADNWLAASPMAGGVAGGRSARVTLSFDTDEIQEGSYRTVVHVTDFNAINGIDSVVVLLRVVSGPVVTVQPAGDTVAAGSRVVLRVIASGTPPLSYAWHKVGRTETVGTLDSLVFASLSAVDTGGYFCVVSNAVGVDTSDTAWVGLEPAVGVTRAQRVPATLVLSGVCPNPVRGTAVIRYGVPKAGLSRVTFQVVDIGGRIVWQETRAGAIEPGYHQVAWDGRSDDGGLLPAGYYLVTMTAVIRGTNAVKVQRTQVMLMGR